tara:strand:- start:3316 stop:3657 length:342 start_codon:yes stop_codon:yes gene_type:complete
MKKFLILLTFFFAVKFEAGEPPVTDDDVNKLFTAMIVAGSLAFIVASYSNSADEPDSSDYVFYDKHNNSVIFLKDSGLENLEINFSNQVTKSMIQTNNLFAEDNLYIGFKYRF